MKLSLSTGGAMVDKFPVNVMLGTQCSNKWHLVLLFEFSSLRSMA